MHVSVAAMRSAVPETKNNNQWDSLSSMFPNVFFTVTCFNVPAKDMQHEMFT